MNRSGYSDDCDNNWDLIRWRGAVTSAIRGQRGQNFLRRLAATLDAMPEKRLIKNELEHALGGRFCTLGAELHARGVDTLTPEGDTDTGCPEKIAKILEVAPALVKEIMYENDEYGVYRHNKDTQDQSRWHHMRRWVENHLQPLTPAQHD